MRVHRHTTAAICHEERCTLVVVSRRAADTTKIMGEPDPNKRVEYAAGWRPEPYKPRDDVWEKMLYNGHAKI